MHVYTEDNQHIHSHGTLAEKDSTLAQLNMGNLNPDALADA